MPRRRPWPRNRIEAGREQDLEPHPYDSQLDHDRQHDRAADDGHKRGAGIGM